MLHRPEGRRRRSAPPGQPRAGGGRPPQRGDPLGRWGRRVRFPLSRDHGPWADLHQVGLVGQPLGDAIRDNLPLGGAFVLVWTVARWLLALGALMVLFAAFYYVAPNRDSPRWAWVRPGGVLAACIWLAASLGFSFHVSSFGSYAETYGSLAGVVVLLLWLYLSALAVMLGGELNAELERQSTLNAGQVGGRGPGRRREDHGSAENGAPARGQDPGDGSPASVREWAARMRELRAEDRDSTAEGGVRALR